MEKTKTMNEIKFSKEELIEYIKMFANYYETDENTFFHKLVELSFETISPLFAMVNPLNETIMIDTQKEEMLVCFRKTYDDKVKYGYIKKEDVETEPPDTLFDLFRGTYRQGEIFHNGRLVNVKTKKRGRPITRNKEIEETNE